MVGGRGRRNLEVFIKRRLFSFFSLSFLLPPLSPRRRKRDRRLLLLSRKKKLKNVIFVACSSSSKGGGKTFLCTVSLPSIPVWEKGGGRLEEDGGKKVGMKFLEGGEASFSLLLLLLSPVFDIQVIMRQKNRGGGGGKGQKKRPLFPSCS